MASQEAVIDWLLAGDPAIWWQVMRDLLDEPAETWERGTTPNGRERLGRRAPRAHGTRRRVAEGTLDRLYLDAPSACRVRLPESHSAARPPVERLLGRFMPEGERTSTARSC